MIAFGSAIQGAEAYRKYAEPGVRRAAERDSEVYAFAAVQPVGRTYNLILDAAAARDDLEALALVHPHTEIADDDFCETVRAVVCADPSVGVAGCAGAVGVRSIGWWEGSVTSSRRILHRYGEFGGGELPAFSWVGRRSLVPVSPGPPAEVETVDGQLLVLSKWAVRNLRFDESLRFSFGFDLDFCCSVRAGGRRVVVADFGAVFHRSLELVKDLDVWAAAHMQVAEKWDAMLNGPAGSLDGRADSGIADDAHWKRRARYAEADREAARAFAFSRSLKLDAQVLELELEFDEMINSVSWRMTAPLRAANRLRRRRLRREDETE